MFNYVNFTIVYYESQSLWRIIHYIYVEIA
jgi:hypothetical protein